MIVPANQEYRSLDGMNVTVALIGCGRLGSALLEGWLSGEVFHPKKLRILAHSVPGIAKLASNRGALVNPPIEALKDADVIVLAVKPSVWRQAIVPLVPNFAASAVIVSVMAGVCSADIAAVSGRRVVRVMPTTAVAQAKGVAAVWAADANDRAIAHALFGPLADVIDLADESMMDAATAVAGSAPAFIHAFTQALAKAGEARGLSHDAAVRLATGALRSAGAGADTGASLDDLIARIASPGGTTQAGLDAMAESGDLDRAAEAAVKAAVGRAGELSV